MTANYAFLNYLVLSLGVLLLDDGQCEWVLRRLRLWQRVARPVEAAEQQSLSALPWQAPVRRWIAAACLFAVAYATTAEMVNMVFPLPWLLGPARLLEPFRVANQYGLFAVMTRGRFEIELQGSNDGQHWTAYPFRFKPQALGQAPGIYAPYQPRLDWNLWFASLGDWRQNPLVVQLEERLLEGSPEVLGLFAGDPFGAAPPRMVRAVLWRYWFTSLAEKRRTGDWWTRRLLGVYAPVLRRGEGGDFFVVGQPDALGVHD